MKIETDYFNNLPRRTIHTPAKIPKRNLCRQLKCARRNATSGCYGDVVTRRPLRRAQTELEDGYQPIELKGRAGIIVGPCHHATSKTVFELVYGAH